MKNDLLLWRTYLNRWVQRRLCTLCPSFSVTVHFCVFLCPNECMCYLILYPGSGKITAEKRADLWSQTKPCASELWDPVCTIKQLALADGSSAHFMEGHGGHRHRHVFPCTGRKVREYLKGPICRPANTVLMSCLLAPKCSYLDRPDDHLHLQSQGKCFPSFMFLSSLILSTVFELLHDSASLWPIFFSPMCF